MNEKRMPAQPENLPATRSDVAPKRHHSSGVAPRTSSGFQAAVRIPPPPPAPSSDLGHAEDIDRAWDDGDPDAGEDVDQTVLDPRIFEVAHATQAAQEASAAAVSAPAFDEAPAPQSGEEARTPEPTPTEPDLGDEPPPEVTAMMPAFTPTPPPPATPMPPTVGRPAQPPAPRFVPPSSIVLPPGTPRTSTGVPVLPPPSVRRAFLSTLAIPEDPPPRRLITVALLCFFGTLIVASLIAWIAYLLGH